MCYSILQGVRLLADILKEDRNKLLRYFLTDEEGVYEGSESQADALFSELEREVFRRSGSHAVRLKSRPNPLRPASLCYRNAYQEWKASGNSPVIGWEVIPVGSPITTVVHFIPHACNLNSKTGEYYDTDTFKKLKGDKRAFVPRLSPEDSQAFLTHHQTTKKLPFDPNDVWGGLLALLKGDKFYLIEEWGRNEAEAYKTFKMGGVLTAEPEGDAKRAEDPAS